MDKEIKAIDNSGARFEHASHFGSITAFVTALLMIVFTVVNKRKLAQRKA